MFLQLDGIYPGIVKTIDVSSDGIETYNQTPDNLAAVLQEYASAGLVNIIGGCCGTGPEHIRAMAEAVRDIRPRAVPKKEKYCRLSGLEPLVIKPDSLFAP